MTTATLEPPVTHADASPYSVRSDALALARDVLSSLWQRAMTLQAAPAFELVYRMWDARLAAEANVYPDLRLADDAVVTLEALSRDARRFGAELALDWLDLFPRNVLDLVTVEFVASRSAELGSERPPQVPARASSREEQGWLHRAGNRRPALALAA